MWGRIEWGGRKSSRRVLAGLKGGCEEREFPSFLYIFSYIPRRSLGKVCCLKQRALPPSINHCRVLVWLAHHRRHPSLSSPSPLLPLPRISRRAGGRLFGNIIEGCHRGKGKPRPSRSFATGLGPPLSPPVSAYLWVSVCVCVWAKGFSIDTNNRFGNFLLSRCHPSLHARHW